VTRYNITSVIAMVVPSFIRYTRSITSPTCSIPIIPSLVVVTVAIVISILVDVMVIAVIGIGIVIVTVLPVPCSLSPRVVVVPPLTMIPLIAMSRSIVMHWHMCEYGCNWD
jgi:hypothetical protein